MKLCKATVSFVLPELDDLKNLFASFFQPVSNILESHLLLQTSF